MSKRWYPKTTGRAARFLRRNRKDDSNPVTIWRRLICQIRLDRVANSRYNASTGAFLS
jgi:hypothetical protein